MALLSVELKDINFDRELSRLMTQRLIYEPNILDSDLKKILNIGWI